MTILLIHSPLVGPGSLQPTANALIKHGVAARVLKTHNEAGTPPAWRDLPAHLLAQMERRDGHVLVGHSMAGLLAADLAGRTRARGLVYLDANIAPTAGTIGPAEPSFLDFVKSLDPGTGVLPPWADWWGDGAFDRLPLSDTARRALHDEAPQIPLAWFDDTFEIDDWSEIPTGYLQTSAVFDEQADMARGRNWPCLSLDGSHLHPMAFPDETANALRAIFEEMKVTV